RVAPAGIVTPRRAARVASVLVLAAGAAAAATTARPSERSPATSHPVAGATTRPTEPPRRFDGAPLVLPAITQPAVVPTLVSRPTPFGSCSVRRGVTPGAEAEPWTAVDPANRANLLRRRQQDPHR